MMKILWIYIIIMLTGCALWLPVVKESAREIEIIAEDLEKEEVEVVQQKLKDIPH